MSIFFATNTAEDMTAEDQMNAMAPIPVRPAPVADLHHRRVRLTREPASAALARGEVAAAIREWRVQVDADVAVLLTSDLVTNAIVRGEGSHLTMAMRYARGRLRVDVYDTWRALPLVTDTAASMESGPGLALVATLSDEWGTFRTPAGMAVFFALDAMADEAATDELPRAAAQRRAGDQTWGRRAVTPPGSSPSPLPEESNE
jgi:hypothetical protein